MIKLTRALITVLFVITGWSAASAETIAVIGTGNVGGALGPRFSELGHDIIYGSRQPQRTDVQALVARTFGNARAMLPAEAPLSGPGRRLSPCTGMAMVGWSR